MGVAVFMQNTVRRSQTFCVSAGLVPSKWQLLTYLIALAHNHCDWSVGPSILFDVTRMY